MYHCTPVQRTFYSCNSTTATHRTRPPRFIKFKDYKGRQSNNSYHVPACDWYGDLKSGPPKCSGFYHDQEQTPNHAKPGGGSYPAYRVDGECVEQCDCGKTNPCGEWLCTLSGYAH
jgi:hypothetical protein